MHFKGFENQFSRLNENFYRKIKNSMSILWKIIRLMKSFSQELIHPIWNVNYIKNKSLRYTALESMKILN